MWEEGRWEEEKFRPYCGWIAVSPGWDGPSQENEGVQGLFEQWMHLADLEQTS